MFRDTTQVNYDSHVVSHVSRMGSGWAAVGNDLEAARELPGATPTCVLENHAIRFLTC